MTALGLILSAGFLVDNIQSYELVKSDYTELKNKITSNHEDLIEYYARVLPDDAKSFFQLNPSEVEDLENSYDDIIYSSLDDLRDVWLRNAVIMFIIFILTVLLVLLYGVRASRKSLKPLEQIQHMINSMSKGDFHQDFKAVSANSRDEFGDIAKMLDSMQTEVNNNLKTGAEINVAAKIQNAMLRKDFKQLTSSQITAHALLEPAQTVGGDFYDVFTPDGKHFYYLVADVSDKGVAAAMFMSYALSEIRSIVLQTCAAPSEILNATNIVLQHNNNSMMFVTCFLGRLNILTGEMEYCIAGHNPPLLMRQNQDSNPEVVWLDQPINPALAIMEQVHYLQEKTVLKPGDLLLCYTDGVTEAQNSDYELFGESRLVDCITKTLAGDNFLKTSTEDVVKAVANAVSQFRANCKVNDDETLLALRYLEDDHNGNVQIFDASIAGFTLAGAFLTEHFEQSSVPDDVRGQIELIFEELFINIVKYAYPKTSSSGTVTVRVNVEGNRFTIQLVDYGLPYNPLALNEPDIDAPLEERNVGGMGVHLARQLADDLAYEFIDGHNMISFSKEF
ncbi:MAG: SpoIIE family protein phosphatase [Candidatus Ancillula sp.]|nr:SpoIIE family protein phosphatase [Candidatus Ancillula sp.]